MDKASVGAKLKKKGDEHFSGGNYKKAHDCYTEAIGVNPDCEDTAVYYRNRAAALFKMKKYFLASTDCTRALVLVPDDARSLYWRSLAMEQLGEYELAYEDAKEVLHIDPYHKPIQGVVKRIYPFIRQQHPEREDWGSLTRGKRYPLENDEGGIIFVTWRGPKAGYVLDNGRSMPMKPRIQPGKFGDSYSFVINDNKVCHAEWNGDCYKGSDGTEIDLVAPGQTGTNLMNNTKYKEGKEGWKEKKGVKYDILKPDDVLPHRVKETKKEPGPATASKGAQSKSVKQEGAKGSQAQAKTGSMALEKTGSQAQAKTGSQAWTKPAKKKKVPTATLR